MKLDNLICYQKIGDIALQIQGLQEHLKQLHSELPSDIKVIGLKPENSDETYPMDYLIDFHYKRISLLEQIVHQEINETLKIRNEYYKSLCLSCKGNYLTRSCGPCKKDYESWCFIELIDLTVREDGPR